MKQRRMHPLLMGSLPAFFIFGSFFVTNLITGLRSDPDIWWSSRGLPIDHQKSRESVEIYIQDLAVDKVLMTNRLAMVSPDGRATPVSRDDITVRLNSWPQVRARSLGLAALFGFLFGACLVMVIIGMIIPASVRSAPAEDKPAPAEP